MSTKNCFEIIKDILHGQQQTKEDFINLIEKEDVYTMMYGANLLRQRYKGNFVDLCSLLNAKSGSCAEDCKFCAQSAHHSTNASNYPLVSVDTMVDCFKKAAASGTNRFDIVTSGNELSEEEFDTICKAIEKMNSEGDKLNICCSVGTLSLERARKLKDMGVTRLHHNIETSRNFFPKVCSTHSYDDRVQTIKNIKETGIEVCSGGILGMGESWEDRVDMAIELRTLDVDAIPLNFLVPIQGTQFENFSPLTPVEILKIIALFRFVLPDKDIRVCGGREKNLRSVQSWIFFAGANAMMIGGYLTIAGREIDDDLQMIKDLGFIARMDAPADKP